MPEQYEYALVPDLAHEIVAYLSAYLEDNGDDESQRLIRALEHLVPEPPEAS